MTNKIIDSLSEGGRGIQLMWQLADDLSYTHTPADQNCLLLVKSYYSKGLTQSQNLPASGSFKPLRNFLNRFNHLKFKLQPKDNISDPPLQKIRLQVKTDLKALAQVLQWYEQLEELPIPKKILEECKVALAEGFTNAVRHAHKNMPVETPIELEVTVFNNRLEMRIWDYGQAFDLKAKLREILTSKSSFRMKMS
jgi:serine/threonine-protein kinase RsbW